MSTNFKKELSLQFHGQSSLLLSCNHLVTEAASVRVLEFLPKDSQGLLISFSHSLLNTQIDLTGVSPYVALQFDDENSYQGASLSLGSSVGTFGIITQSKTVLIIPFKIYGRLEKISGLNLEPTH